MGEWEEKNYLEPVRSVIPSPTFIFLVIFKVKIKGNGNASIITSVIIFGKLAYRNNFSMLKWHFPTRVLSQK